MAGKILSFLILVLIVVVAGGLYLTSGMDHSNMNMENLVPQQQQADQKNGAKATTVLYPDLRNYVDDINNGISLINEANSFITADPFFASPPKVSDGNTSELKVQPQKQLPAQRNNPVILYPDGSYVELAYNNQDMRALHQGLYKLGQGMTVLDMALKRMNDDIRNNNFSSSPPILPYGFGTILPNFSPGAMYPNTANGYPNAAMQHTTSGFDWTTVSSIIYFVLFAFIVLAIVSVFGFIVNLFRKPNTQPH